MDNSQGEVVSQLDSLSPTVRSRVLELLELQKEHDAVEAEYFEKTDELQVEYQKRYEPLFIERFKIVTGETAETEDRDSGVPNFWLRAMQNNDILAKEITEDDAKVLKYLNDINLCKTTSPKGFMLKFQFRQNLEMKSLLLTKLFPVGDDEQPNLRFSIGSEIDWHDKKNVTVYKKGARERPVDSFFNFFKTPALLMGDDTEDCLEKLTNQMEVDYRIMYILKHKVIPHAFSWFTGDAAQGVGDEVQDNLQSLVGKHCEALESLPLRVIKDLRCNQIEYDEIEAEHDAAQGKIAADYQDLFKVYYDKRFNIVNAAKVEGSTSKIVEATCDITEEEKGVPNFWATALRKNKRLADFVEDCDGAPLRDLKDITWCRNDKQNEFQIDFSFRPNEYFKNPTLTKTYCMTNDRVPVLMEKNATGTAIQWLKGKYPAGRSFFNFFNPPIPRRINNVEDDELVEKTVKSIGEDYEIGEIIRDEIIPWAVQWYTGEAVNAKRRRRS